MGCENPEVFTDIQSGRNDDRPDFEKLIGKIQRREVDLVIIARIDRITRNLEMNARLVKLFESTGVKLYEGLLGRVLNFEADWEYFVTSGVRAEGESRTLSIRIRAGKKFLRHLGRVQGGKVPLGYQRSEEGKYEPDLERWEIAQQMIAVFLRCRSPVAASREIHRSLGVSMHYNSLLRWLQNDVLRGHTPYLLDKKRVNGKRLPKEIRYNTHPALLPPPLAKEVDEMLAEVRQQRGVNVNHRVYPLSGLMWCELCGGNCTISVMPSGKNNERWLVYCGNYRKGIKGTICGDRLSPNGKPAPKGKVGFSYGKIEEAVIDALCQRSIELATSTVEDLKVLPTITPPSVEVLEVERHIAQIEQLIQAMGDESGLLRQKIAEIKSKIPTPENQGEDSEESKQLLITVGSDRLYWEQLTSLDRKLIFKRFVKVWLNRDTRDIQVELSI